MAFTIEETILVAAPPESIWKLVVDPHSWRLWWPGCLDAAADDRKQLHDGSKFRLVLRPGWLTRRLRPTVAAATPGKALIWASTHAGITGRHAFYLEGRPNGTLVRQREDYSGPGVFLMRLTRLDHAHARMFRASLRGLKRMVERGG